MFECQFENISATLPIKTLLVSLKIFLTDHIRSAGNPFKEKGLERLVLLSSPFMVRQQKETQTAGMQSNTVEPPTPSTLIAV